MTVEHWLNSELHAYIDKMGSSRRIIHMHETKPATHSPETVEMWLIVCVYTTHTNIPGSEEPV